MLFTDPQNQFKTAVERNLRGEPLELEPGYREAYADWSKEKEAILPKLSAEERTASFSDDMEDKVQAEEKRIIEETEPDPGKRKKLFNQAQRGQLLLVSTDGGKTFDKVLNVHEGQKIGPLTLRFKSPTLRSTTNNVEEVAEEQAMLHAVRKLRQQHFLVERAWVENHTVHIDATHPRSGKYEVKVPLDQDPTLPLEYTFQNQQGIQKMQETQLPNEYGEAAPDRSLEVPDPGTILAQSTLHAKETRQGEQTEQASKVALSSFLSFVGAKKAEEKNQVSTMARAMAAAEQTRLQMQAPGIHQDVIAAKASTAARKARQDKQMKGEEERLRQREEHYKSAAKKAYQKQQEEEKEKAEKQKTADAQLRQKMTAGAGAAAGLFAGAGGLLFSIVHITHG